MAVAAKPDVEIWRRPKKWTFWPWFPIHSFRHFFARTYRFATIQNITDRRQTDRQTTHRAKGTTDGMVGQKICPLDASCSWITLGSCFIVNLLCVRTMVMEPSPTPQCVGREFVKQYYTMLNQAPNFLHRHVSFLLLFELYVYMMYRVRISSANRS